MFPRLLLLSTILVFAGCFTPPEGAREPNALELEQLDRTESAWAAAGLDPIGRQCVEEREMLRIVVVDSDEEMKDLTAYCGPPPVRGECDWDSERVQSGRCPYGCAAGVSRRYREGAWPFALVESWPMYVLWHEAPPEQILPHEHLHQLERCTGRGVDHRHGLVCTTEQGEWCHGANVDGCTCVRTGPVWGPNGVHRQLRRP